jgi:hypothetical protein
MSTPKLSDRRKALYKFFEEHVEVIKTIAGDGHKWVVISDVAFYPDTNVRMVFQLNTEHAVWFKSPPTIDMDERVDERWNVEDDLWVGYLSTIDCVEKAITDYSDVKLEGMLFCSIQK